MSKSFEGLLAKREKERERVRENELRRELSRNRADEQERTVKREWNQERMLQSSSQNKSERWKVEGSIDSDFFQPFVRRQMMAANVLMDWLEM